MATDKEIVRAMKSGAIFFQVKLKDNTIIPCFGVEFMHDEEIWLYVGESEEGKTMIHSVHPSTIASIGHLDMSIKN